MMRLDVLGWVDIGGISLSLKRRGGGMGEGDGGEIRRRGGSRAVIGM